VPVDPDGVTANLKNGVLEIRLKPRGDEKPGEIKIHIE
jgi:HSP20 family molecular chaperone IbpA